MRTWGVAQAKAQFSAVIEKAIREGPQAITKGGKDAVVIVSKREWRKLAESQNATPNTTKFISAWDALKPSFDERYDIDFPRTEGTTRDVDFG
jgi:prevent-host-death family protein